MFPYSALSRVEISKQSTGSDPRGVIACCRLYYSNLRWSFFVLSLVVTVFCVVVLSVIVIVGAVVGL